MQCFIPYQTEGHHAIGLLVTPILLYNQSEIQHWVSRLHFLHRLKA